MRDDVLDVCARHGPVVDDAGVRGVQRTDAGRMRLDLLQLAAVEHAQVLDAVCDRATVQLLEPAELRVVERDDQLAAANEWDPSLLGIPLESLLPVDAETCLERPRCVVDAGVEDARVVAGLMRPRRRLLLEHDEAEPGSLDEERAGGCQADDPCADHGHVEALVAACHRR